MRICNPGDTLQKQSITKQNLNQIDRHSLPCVLESNYNQNREQIAYIIEQLLQVGQLEVMEPEVVWRALTDYKNSNADFPDHLLTRVNESQGCEITMTFNKKSAKQPSFQILK